MMRLRLSEAAAATGGTRSGEDVAFAGCGMDSRTLPAGALFVALPGARTDGHDFLAAARARGAAAALVSRPVAVDLPTVRVADTRRALGDLAAAWRRRVPVPLVGITGSNGKTTVKEMTAAILGRLGPTLATAGNLNNDLGVPLTLARLGPEHRFAVVEMGANHPGEIARLCAIAAPGVSVITQCAPAHLEGFGSVAGVARAKGEIVAGLPPDGLAVLNADDPFLDLWRDLAGARRVVTFGLERPADLSARWTADRDGSRVEMTTPGGEVSLRLPLPGRHNVANALAAAAVGLALGASLEEVADGLASVRAVEGRLQLRELGGLSVLDDTYNANPGSLAAALQVLATLPGARWLVMGDMGELGEGAAALHREAGARARQAGVGHLYGVGPLTRHAIEAFGSGGRHFEDHATLVAALRAEATAPAAVLVKGSRAMGMERVVQALAGEG
jgi:UDP-N-acetylmuramoyl-tripeptide--D-alanyl-D-alanine ligase